tara:strand:+ start:575 stop:832 length:258 start_codon:yes stop_codon:yes gene_type:complete
MPRLKLERFRKLYKSLKTPWKPLNWLILGYLIGIEDRYIDIVSKQTVDKAIKEYKEQINDTTKLEITKTKDGGFSIGYIPEKQND